MPKLVQTADRVDLEAVTGLLELIHLGSMYQAVCVAAELFIPDFLASGPKSVDELARATGCHTASLHRFLRAITSLELCTEREDGLFEQSLMGSLLRSDTPNSLRSWIIWRGRYESFA